MTYQNSETYTYQDEAVEFSYKEKLSLSEKMNFVVDVTRLIIDEHDFHHIIYNTVFYYGIIKYLTDIDVPAAYSNDGLNLDSIEEFLHHSDVIPILQLKVNSLIEELKSACEISISYKTGNLKHRLYAESSDTI